eukprot:gb/GEZN01011895.1/.p1 GENE.gb/GEZN01011895.1/~~gb/GEZN01011895.1/.p1  ORF type:complete len:178 (+),score=32.00 gb/GEZN01011895.1/:301-834(+)
MATSKAASPAPAGPVDLAEYIYKEGTHCMNEDAKNTLNNCIKSPARENDNLFLQSSADGQLLVTVAFSMPMKLSGIIINGPVDSGPSSVKLFANHKNIDFDMAEEENGEQNIPLSKEQLKGEKPIPLRFVKFQKVSSLSLFFPGNHADEDTTKISKIVFIGTPPPTEGSKVKAGCSC